MKFYSSVRLDVRRIESLKQGGEVVGNRTRIKVVKNKVAPPFKEAEFDIMFGRGISREGDVLDLAVEKKIIQKSGAWFAYKESKIGQGRENSKNYLREHPEILDEVEAKVRAACQLTAEQTPQEESQKNTETGEAQKNAETGEAQKDTKTGEAQKDTKTGEAQKDTKTGEA